MTIDNLPSQLREHGLFCCWRYEQREGSGKPTKVPYNPRTGGKAQSTNPQTFAPLAVALAAVDSGGYDGIGVGVFGALGAIDIDHCLNDNGALSDMAEDIAATMGTYTEFSPSGKGLRILFTVPDRFQYDKARYYINNQRAGLEVYIAGATQKYVTVTGNTFTPGLELEERGEQLRAVLEKYMVRPQAQHPIPGELAWDAAIGCGAPAALDDPALIERAKRSKNGAAFTALWAGDTTGYKSRSEADIALCNALAFWTNKDAARMDRLFRQSGLMREKWDRSQSGSTYGAITIQNAVSTTREGYDPAAYRQQSAACDFAPAAGQSPEVKKHILMPMSGVEARAPSYLISPYLPEGMLAIMGGVSGSGKTYLVLSWAAAISNGQRLPFQRQADPAPPAGYVYYFTQENDPNTIIRPRLDLLGANLDRVLIQASTGGTYEPLTMNDPRLEEAAKDYPPALVIFDPIQSYLGGGVDMSRAEQVRPTLDWLGDYAKRHKCSVVLVSHMSKPGRGEMSALDRLLGSSDFRNAARSIVIVGRDPSDKETRIFAHGKNSIGEPGPSQKYHISGRGITYDGPSDLTADDIIKQSAEQTRNKPAATLTATMAKLEELLGDEGWATLAQVETWQTLEGISQRTLYNARKELALKTVSIGQPPNRTTWWLRSDVDMEWFKTIHTPNPEPMEQLELSQ